MNSTRLLFTCLVLFLNINIIAATTVSVEAYVGERVTLPCHTGHTDQHPANWEYKKSTTSSAALVSSAGILVNGFNKTRELDATAVGRQDLIIIKALTTDSGLYTCTPDGGFGNASTMELQVKHSATNGPITSRVTFLGETFVFRCKTTSDVQKIEWMYQKTPADLAEWVYSDGMMYNGFDNRFMVDFTVSGSYNLVALSVKKNDEGTYICAVNEQKYYTRLKVLTRIAPTTKLQRVVRLGETTETILPCTLSETSSYVSWWYTNLTTRELCEVARSTHVFGAYHAKFSIDRSSQKYYNLTARNLESSDSGDYMCIEYFDNGIARQTIVSLHFTPTDSVVTETESSSNTAKIVGIVVGVVALPVIIVLVWIFVKRRHNKRRARCDDNSTDNKHSVNDAAEDQPMMAQDAGPIKLPVVPQPSNATVPSSTARFDGNSTDNEHSVNDAAEGQPMMAQDAGPNRLRGVHQTSNPTAPSSTDVLEATIKCYPEHVDALRKLDCGATGDRRAIIVKELVDLLAQNTFLLDKLRDKVHLTQNEMNAIQRADDYGSEIYLKSINDFMSMRTDNDLRRLADVCRDENHEDIANLFIEFIGERSASKLMGLPLLRFILESRFHFRRRLCERGILTDAEATDVKNQPTAFEQNDRIIYYFQQKPEKRKDFLDILKIGHQLHVINYMECADAATIGDIRPLGATELQRIVNNFDHLVNTIVPNTGFIDALENGGYMSFRQRKCIDKSQDEKNRKLLDMLTRRSVADFKLFIKLLNDNGQTEAANLLSGRTLQCNMIV